MTNLQALSMAEQKAIMEHINALNTIKKVIIPFSGKVVNKKLIDAINATEIYVSWYDDYRGIKEMIHRANTKGIKVDPQYRREMKVPLVINDKRLILKETNEAIDKELTFMNEQYERFEFNQESHDADIVEIKALKEKIKTILESNKNPHATNSMNELQRAMYWR